MAPATSSPIPASAAGGGEAQAHLADVSTVKFSTSIDKYLRGIFESLAGGNNWATGDQMRQFFQHIQHDPAPKQLLAVSGNLKSSSYDEFARYAGSPSFTAMAPPIPHDLNHPLPSYFISSSHNTYLSGNQLYSKCDANTYRNVLLRGCRCVEIDVWDGEKVSSSPDKSSSLHPELHRNVSSGIISRLRSSSRSNSDKFGVDKVVERFAHVKLNGKGGSNDANAEPSMPKPWRAGSGEVVEPQVMHALGGQSLSKGISFRSVCEAIAETAFVASELPIIISLEVHAGKPQQEIMVEIMKETWGEHLVHNVPEHLDRCETKLASPNELRKKILIKVKYVKPEESDPTAKTRGRSNSATKQAPSASEKSAKPSKITESLGGMAVYTRAYKFKSLDQPEAKYPAHIFSIGESDVLKLHNEQGAALAAHNRKYMVRIYPGGKRVRSSNLDPSVLWRMGAQMVALNWQNCDQGMMLNEGMFAGEDGWVLKPSGYYEANLPIRRYVLNLTIELFAAQLLPLPHSEGSAAGFHPYVSCELHVEKPDEREHRLTEDSLHPKGGDQKQKSQAKRGINPDFGREQLQFKDIHAVVPELSFVRFKVKDKELGKDSLAAWACIRLDRLNTGYRFVKLLDSIGNETSGAILVKITKQLHLETES